MTDIYDTLFVQRGAEEAFKIAADDARKLRIALIEITEAAREAENALADYIPTIEKTGASLNYGHSVLRRLRTVLNPLRKRGKTE